MKIIYILVISAVLLLAGFTSCKKFLDANPDKNLTVPKTLNELEGLFNDADRMNFDLTPSFGESYADDYFLLEATYNSLWTQAQQIYIWSLQDYVYKNDWAVNYTPVYNANFALEGLEKIEKTTTNTTQWNAVKGYALFTRAYSYLNLAWQYAKAYDATTAETDLGIVLRTGSDFNVPSKRATVKETYEHIIDDASEAINYLPASQPNVLLPSKAAAYGLLARAYLSMGDEENALKYADLYLSLKSDLLDYNNVDLDVNTSFSPRFDNPETIFYTEMNTYNITHYSFYGLIDSTLYMSYHNDDLRKKGFFNLQGQYQKFKGSYTGNSILLFTGIATDEIVLIKAECHARKNELEDAMTALNTLMRKRWDNSVPYPEITATNQEDALDKILAERRKELLMRGIRLSDIKRLNKEGRNIILTRKIGTETFTLPPNDNRYALPLPSDIINLTGMPQNEP